jgi:hypothetical protein
MAKIAQQNETFTPRKMQGRDDVKKEIYAKEIKLIDDFVNSWQKNKRAIYETTNRMFAYCRQEGAGGMVETGTQVVVKNIKRSDDLEGTVQVTTEEELNWDFDLLDFAQHTESSNMPLKESALRKYGRFMFQILRELDEKLNEHGLDATYQEGYDKITVKFADDDSLTLTLSGTDMGKLYKGTLTKKTGDNSVEIPLSNPKDLDAVLQDTRKELAKQ